MLAPRASGVVVSGMLDHRAAGDKFDRRAGAVDDSEYGWVSFWRRRRLAQRRSARLELLGLEGLAEMGMGRGSKVEEQEDRVRDSEGLDSTVAVVVMASGCCHCSDRIARMVGNPRSAAGRFGVHASVAEAGAALVLQEMLII